MQDNTNQICLLCQTGNLSDHIYINSDIGHIVNQHFAIETCDADYNEQLICTKCWIITNEFHKLYEKVYQNRNVSHGPIKREDHLYYHDGDVTEGPNIKNEQQLNGISDDNREDTEESNQVDVPSKKSRSKKCKTSTASSLQLNSKQTNSKSVSSDCSENDTDDTDKYPDLETKTKGDNCPKRIKSLNKSSIAKKPHTSVTSKNMLQQNQQIKEFFSMTCDLCEYNFNNYLDVRTHYTKIHKQIGYLKCCNKKIYRRNLILDHMNRHLNPNAYKCPECNKIFVNKKVLKNHMDHHTPIDQRPFKCDICTSSYTKLYKLSQHIKFSHCFQSDKTFQCAECNKSFISKSILTTHIRGVHEFAYAHVCHICAKTFKSKQVYELHQQEHLDVEVPKVQCKICDKWFKHEHSLRRHMYRHNDGEASCTLCNKVAPNKNALGSHMRDVHRERTHKCSLCEKAFIKARSLKEHIATHTGLDIYTCNYCPTTFKSSANMHSHRKKVHFDDWLLEREKRQRP